MGPMFTLVLSEIDLTLSTIPMSVPKELLMHSKIDASRLPQPEALYASWRLQAILGISVPTYFEPVRQGKRRALVVSRDGMVLV